MKTYNKIVIMPLAFLAVMMLAIIGGMAFEGIRLPEPKTTPNTPTTRLRTPMYEVYEVNFGVSFAIPASDATVSLIARFDTLEQAENFLAKRHYNYREWGGYADADPAKRDCVGQIIYRIVKDKQVPENPE